MTTPKQKTVEEIVEWVRNFQRASFENSKAVRGETLEAMFIGGCIACERLLAFIEGEE